MTETEQGRTGRDTRVKVIRILIFLSFVIASFSILVHLYFRIPTPVETPSPPIMSFALQDGNIENDTGGCFFIIRAEKAVDIYPNNYTFWVSKEGYSPKKPDLRFRDYLPNEAPVGGDRNASYRYDDKLQDGQWEDMPVEGKNERWTDGEYIRRNPLRGPPPFGAGCPLCSVESRFDCTLGSKLPTGERGSRFLLCLEEARFRKMQRSGTVREHRG